jgi:hypothetical protein
MEQPLLGYATRRNIGWSVVLDVLFLTVIMPWMKAILAQKGHGGEPLDLKFAYSTELAVRTLSTFGREGRRTYAMIELSADLVFPLVYGTSLALALTLLLRHMKVHPILYFFALIPFAAVVVDYLENICIVWMLLNFPQVGQKIPQLASNFTTAKWIIIAFSFGSVALFLLVLIGRRLRVVRRKTRSSIKF